MAVTTLGRPGSTSRKIEASWAPRSQSALTSWRIGPSAARTLSTYCTRTELAARDEVADRRDRRVVDERVPDHHDAVAARRLDAVDLLRRRRERLLHQHVLAGLERRDREVRVRRGRRGDDHRLHRRRRPGRPGSRWSGAPAGSGAAAARAPSSLRSQHHTSSASAVLDGDAGEVRSPVAEADEGDADGLAHETALASSAPTRLAHGRGHASRRPASGRCGPMGSDSTSSASRSATGRLPAVEPRGVGARQVRRDRVVDDRVDAGLREPRLQRVAPRMAHDEQVPHRLGPVGHRRQREPVDAGEPLEVARGHRAPALVPLVQAPQLDAQEGGLQRVQAAVEPRQIVVVLHLRAVVAQHADALGQRVVVGRDRARVAQRAEVLAGVEREAGGVARGRRRGGPGSARPAPAPRPRSPGCRGRARAPRARPCRPAARTGAPA